MQQLDIPSCTRRPGSALAPLRDKGRYDRGRGMSYHNFGRYVFGTRRGCPPGAFDAWMGECRARSADQRSTAREVREGNRGRGLATRREEHLIP